MDLKKELVFLLTRIFSSHNKEFKDFCFDLGVQTFLATEFAINKVVESVPAYKIAKKILEQPHFISTTIGEVAEQQMLEQAVLNCISSPKYQDAIEKDVESWQSDSRRCLEALMMASGMSYDTLFVMLMYLPLKEEWIKDLIKSRLGNSKGRHLINSLKEIIDPLDQ